MTTIKSGMTYGKVLEMWLDLKETCEFYEDCYPRCEPENCHKIMRRLQ